jgi:competence protein ComEA
MTHVKRTLILLAAAALVVAAARHSAAPPSVAVSLQKAAPAAAKPLVRKRPRDERVVVYVAGAVVRPGLYQLPPGARADDAIRRAGGFLRGADPASVNLAERVADGEELQVLRIGQTEHRAARKPSSRRRPRKRRTVPSHAVDLNTAGARELAAIPGVGETLAARIVAFREINGPFASVDELADVSGMTQSRVDRLASYVVVHEGP